MCWHAFSYQELMIGDKVNLDIFWLRDESLEESANLPDPDILVRKIVGDMEAALEQFSGIAEELGENTPNIYCNNKIIYKINFFLLPFFRRWRWENAKPGFVLVP